MPGWDGLCFLFRLAWRNLWRQKRRTLLSAAAITLTFSLSLFMRSMQEGSYAYNLDTAMRISTGFLQLQHPDYADFPTIDHLVPADSQLASRIRALPGITHAVPRLQSYALAAAGDRSRPVLVTGIEPGAEESYSALATKLVKGHYLRDNSREVLVGKGVADRLHLNPGDELALYGQGYQGVTAAGLFRVAGVIHLPLGDADQLLVYLPLAAAQELFAVGEQASFWVLHCRGATAVPALRAAAEERFGSVLRVRDWQELAPELAQQVALDRVSGQFLVVVLYGVAGFGLFATLMMMHLERRREFAVMLASGMGRGQLQVLTLVETALIAVFGMILGLLILLPVLLWLVQHPLSLSGELARSMESLGFAALLPFSLTPGLISGQVAAVAVLAFLCALYPLYCLCRFPLLTALRGRL